MNEFPVVECWRVRNGTEQLAFECPFCWHYGGSYGSSNVSVDYKRRPKNAVPHVHLHSAKGGLRAAHCFSGSPFHANISYLLVEVGTAEIDYSHRHPRLINYKRYINHEREGRLLCL